MEGCYMSNDPWIFVNTGFRVLLLPIYPLPPRESLQGCSEIGQKDVKTRIFFFQNYEWNVFSYQILQWY